MKDFGLLVDEVMVEKGLIVGWLLGLGRRVEEVPSNGVRDEAVEGFLLLGGLTSTALAGLACGTHRILI